MRAFVASSMPSPLSRIVTETYGPGVTSGWCSAYSVLKVILAVSIVSCPPWGMASRALTAKLMIACSNCPGSSLAKPSVGAGIRVSSMFSPIKRRRSLINSVSRILISTTWGCNTCLRLKANSWRVNPAARSPAFWISVTGVRLILSAFRRLKSKWL